jgi:hypothetical protein
LGLTVVIVKGLPAIVVGIQRGIVTPGDGRPPDMTETHAFSGMFFTLPVVVGLSLLLPPSLSPPHATSPMPRVARTPSDRIPVRIQDFVDAMTCSLLCLTTLDGVNLSFLSPGYKSSRLGWLLDAHAGDRTCDHRQLNL